MTLKRISFYLGISVFWLALSLASDGINTLVLPVRLEGRVDPGSRATALGVLTFAGLLLGMLVQPVAGAWSDRLRSRLGRKAFIGLSVVPLLACLALFAVSNSLLLLALSYALAFACLSLAQAAQQGFIPDLVSPAQRGRASGWKAFMDIGGATLGFLLLGSLLGRGQVALALATVGLVVILMYAITAVLVREPPLPDAGLRQPRFSIVDAFRFDFRKHRSFAWLVAARFLFLLGTYAIGRFLLYFVGDRLELSPEEAAAQAGGLLAGLALVTLLFSPLGGWATDRWGRLPASALGSLFSALAAILLIFAAGIWQIFAFGCLLSVGSALFASANWAMTADLAPKDEAARFFALANFGTAGAVAAAGLLGPIVDVANLSLPGSGYAALFGLAALAFLSSALTLRYVRRPAGERSENGLRSVPDQLAGKEGEIL